jgi:hypothetical protein
MGKPKIKTSQISAYAELQALFNKKNLKYIDDGCVFSSEETAQLSSCIKSLSPNYSRKLYAPIHDNKIGCMIGGKIQINSKGANALLYPRLDGPVIDFDLAVFFDDSSELSTVYHPTFNGRTSLSAESKKGIDVVYEMQNFSIPNLSGLSPILYQAFECCKSGTYITK